MFFVNGDSITFGCELHKDDLEYIEEHRFSNIIAKKLDKEVINIANVERTNDSIVRSSIEWIENHEKPEFPQTRKYARLESKITRCPAELAGLAL